MEITREHVRMARQAAWHEILRMPASVELDDLAQVALIALWQALPRVDESRGPVAFLQRRMRGAMLDELRRMDPLSRGHRRRVRAGEAFWSMGDLEEPHELVDPDTPETILARREALSRAARSLSRLSDRDQDIVMRRLQGETVEDVGVAHGISRDRVWQVMRRAMDLAAA